MSGYLVQYWDQNGVHETRRPYPTLGAATRARDRFMRRKRCWQAGVCYAIRGRYGWRAFCALHDRYWRRKHDA